MNKKTEIIQKIDGYSKQAISQHNNAFSYIIGNNGTGKSRLLNELAAHFNNEPVINVVLCITNVVYDKFIAEGSKIKYLGLRSVNNAIFFSAIERTTCAYILECLLNNSLDILEHNLSCKFHFKINEPKNKNDISSYYDNRKTKKKSVDEFISKSQVETLLGLVGKEIKFSSLDNHQINSLHAFMRLNPQTIEVYVQKNDVMHIFADLSSGEQNRILLSSKILSNIKNNSIVIIDEPEISLHLHWQLDFHNFINTIISKYHGVLVIIATHSPIIVSEAYKNERTCTLVILEKQSLYNDDIDYREPDLSRESSFDKIILDFFNTATYHSRTIDEQIARILTNANPEDNIETSIKRLISLQEKTKGLGRKKQLIERAIDVLKAPHLTKPGANND